MAVEIRTREAIRSWMFDQALPFWAAHGLDREHGGYVEQLNLDGSDASVDFNPSVVQLTMTASAGRLELSPARTRASARAVARASALVASRLTMRSSLQPAARQAAATARAAPPAPSRRTGRPEIP